MMTRTVALQELQRRTWVAIGKGMLSVAVFCLGDLMTTTSCVYFVFGE